MSAQPNAMPQCCLCGNWLQFGSKALYGYQVCPKCHTDFAWKRAFAYILDIVFVNVIVGVLIVMAFVIGAIIMAGAQSANNDAAGTAGHHRHLVAPFHHVAVHKPDRVTLRARTLGRSTERPARSRAR